MLIAMTAVKQSANDAVSFLNAAVAGDFRENNDRKTTAFKEIDADQESYGSSSDDIEIYSPKSVIEKVPIAEKDVNIWGRRLHSQIGRIRSEDSHLGKDIGECLIIKVAGSGVSHHMNVMIFPRPPSPLSGKFAASIKMLH